MTGRVRGEGTKSVGTNDLISISGSGLTDRTLPLSAKGK